jgi:hypothetical protein
MFGWLRRRAKGNGGNGGNGGGGAPSTGINLAADVSIPPGLAPARPYIEVQANYWRSNRAELADLQRRGIEVLSWNDRLRLHHLACIELFHQSGAARGELDDDRGPQGGPGSAEAQLAQRLGAMLLAADSPHRPRSCVVWQGAPAAAAPSGEGPQNPPDLQGPLRNSSLTHLGCLEVIRVDAQDRPTAIAFIPLDDVRGILLSRPSLFRAAKILYEGARPDEIVRLPMLYGLSWFTGQTYDTDGSMTRFCSHLRPSPQMTEIGIGIGQQDLMVESSGSMTVFGLSSLGELAVALEMVDPRFDEKCRGRGIDPSEVRRRQHSA